MLTSTRVNLRVLAHGELPNTTGRFGHAAFLALVESVAPELSQALHDNNARQPFTVSPLRVRERAYVNGHLRLREGDDCSMRFTILDSTLFQSFQEALLTTFPAATISLQNIPFAVEEAITTPRPNLWTGYTTFEELLGNVLDDRIITLCFESPTALSRGDTGNGKHFELLPHAWGVFDSLCRKWNAFAETQIANALELRAWVEANVIVSEMRDLNIRVLQFDRFAQKGFVGQVTYQILDDELEMIRRLNALTDFAMYAGVGYKTTMGMGQCRRIVQ